MRKTFITVLAVLALAGATATTATAAKDPRVPAIQQKIAVLQGQVGALTQTLQHEMLSEQCQWAYQISYNIAVYNIFAAMFGQPSYNGAYPNDHGACAAVGSPPPRTLAVRTPLGRVAMFLGLQVGLAH